MVSKHIITLVLPWVLRRFVQLLAADLKFWVFLGNNVAYSSNDKSGTLTADALKMLCHNYD